MRRTVYRWVALLVSLGLFVSACSSGDGDSGDGSGEQGNGEPAPGRSSLQVVSPLEPPNLVPYDGHGSKIQVLSAMLMPIVTVNGEGELVSDSLESWDVSDDGLTVTLHVRGDIEWTDGTPMTSADVAMSLQHFLDPSIGYYASSIGGVAGLAEFLDGEADSISGLSTPDEYTVVVELEEPSPWLAKLAQAWAVLVLPEHILGDVAHDALADHEYFKTFPVTNGPYKFGEVASGQHAELVRNESWSLGEAGFERIFVKWVEQEAAQAQLESGEVQYLPGVPAVDVDRVGSLDGIEIQTAAAFGPPQWWLISQEPLLDRRVRQAMSYAIDREGICEEVYGGYCQVPVTNLPIFEPEWAMPTDGLIEYEYDPDRARELLDEAGWNSDNELTFINTQPDNMTHEIVQGNLADVGVNFSMTNVDISTVSELYEQDPLEFNAIPGGIPSFDPSFLRGRLSCETHFPDGQNQGFYCNRELDELLNAGEREPDQERRGEIYQDALRVVNEEVPNLYLPAPDTIVAHDSRLKGVQARSVYDHWLWNIGEWYWEE